MEEYNESPEEAAVFSAIDANSGYWQVIVEKNGRKKTRIHVTPWTVLICTSHFSNEECLRNVSAGNRRYAISGEMKICSSAS